MQIIFSERFKKQFSKIKDEALKDRICDIMVKLGVNQELGKPLMHDLKNYRSLRIHSYRVIYRLENECAVIVCIEKRANAYEKLAKYLNYNVF